MNIENKYPVIIFRNEFEGRAFYNVGLSKKDQEGNYINGSIACKFKKDVNVEHLSKIYIKKAWLDFYKKEKETVPFIFISEFEYVGDVIQGSKQPSDSEIVQAVMNDEDPFKTFGEELALSDEDLPF